MLKNRKGQWAIIEILVVVAIILVAAYFVYPRYLGGGSSNKADKYSAPPPKQQAESVECRTNLSQVRDAINMYQQSNDSYPSSLADLASLGVSGSLLKCPVSGKPYSYDPSQGRVWCTTPGHERY